jgi:putative FmdB family regulatory protein
MPLYDYECPVCGYRDERIESVETTKVVCLRCKNLANRIISSRSVNVANEDAPWIRSVLEVVDKDSTKPHVVAFRENPTRTNYNLWMKGEGLRPLENGEKRRKEDNTEKAVEYLLKKRYERRAISII